MDADMRFQIGRENRVQTEQKPLTIKNIADHFGVGVITAAKYVRDLPQELVKKVKAGNMLKFEIDNKAIDLIEENFVRIPDNAVPMAELIKKLDVTAAELYNFIHKAGYYDKAIKTGRKNKRFYKIYFTPDIAEEIIKNYGRPTNFKYPLSQQIDKCFINEDLINYMSKHVDLIEKDGDYYLIKHVTITKILDGYMEQLGFTATSEVTNRFSVSRQRIHQIIAKYKHDESVYVKLCSTNRRCTYISNDFINTLHFNEVPENHANITELTTICNEPANVLRKIVLDLDVVLVGNTRYYDIDDVHDKIKYLKNNNQMPVIAPYVASQPTTQQPCENDWVSLSYAAKKLKMSNGEFVLYLKSHSLYNSLNVRTRNGTNTGKHLNVKSTLVNYLTSIRS